MNNLASTLIRTHPRLTLALVLAALILWRFLAARDAGLNLSVDEAQYFLWSLDPAWGYFSKPPMIAWTITASTALCGESEACIRLPALLLFVASSVIVARIGARLGDARTGMLAGIAFATLPLSGFYSWFMTTDALLLFFWSLALLLLLRALESDRWRDWLALGICVGFGLLTKYTMSLFLACALWLLWLDHRPRLASPRPWIAAALALACLVPNLLWNLDHQFATLRHTAEISQLDRQWFKPASLFSFALAQFGVMGPLLLPALLLATADRRAWHTGSPQRLLLLFALPVLGLFLLLAFLSRSHANWAAPAYVAATLAAVAWLIGRGHRRWLTAAIVFNLLFTATLYHWHRIAPAVGIELRKGTDPFHPVRGWDIAGRALANALRHSDCRAVIASDRATLVELAYYGRRALGAPVTPLAYHPGGQVRNHFELTANIAHRPFDCAVLVGGREESVLQREFVEISRLGDLATPAGTHALWRVAGFRGYATAGR